MIKYSGKTKRDLNIKEKEMYPCRFADIKLNGPTSILGTPKKRTITKKVQ